MGNVWYGLPGQEVSLTFPPLLETQGSPKSAKYEDLGPRGAAVQPWGSKSSPGNGRRSRILIVKDMGVVHLGCEAGVGGMPLRVKPFRSLEGAEEFDGSSCYLLCGLMEVVITFWPSCTLLKIS